MHIEQLKVNINLTFLSQLFFTFVNLFIAPQTNKEQIAMVEEEYELVPLSPIRRMEKRLERLEKAGTGTEMIKELIEVVKTNQQIVDDVVRINSDMIKRVSELSQTVDKVTNKIDEFIGRIEVTEGQAAPPQEQNTELQAKMDRLEKRINSMVAMAQNRATATRTAPRPMIVRRPLAPRI